MPTNSVSNEDILELLQESMQMTSDGFERQQKWNEKQQGWNEALRQEMSAMKQTLDSHEVEFAEIKTMIKQIAGEQKAQVADISDILDRLEELSQRSPNITQAEKTEMQLTLQQLLDWAQLAAKNLKVPLKLS